jgi:hypothetical protein
MNEQTTATAPVDERGGWTSASNAEADSLCPGRHLAQRGIPAPPSSRDAEFGTIVHEAMAGRTVDANVEQQGLLTATKEIEAKLVEEFFHGLGQPGKDPQIYREKRLWIEWPAYQLRHSGKPDVIYRAGMRALLIEYKSLFGDVPVSSRNKQLRDQVVLARKGKFIILDEIGVAVIQPAITATPEICLYRKADLDRAEEELLARVRASNDPMSVRNPGEVQCKFCLAKARCVEYQNFAGALVPGMLNIMSVPVANWTPEQRRIFCEKEAMAREWLDNTKDQMKLGLSQDPAYVPGYFLRQGNKVEHINDPEELWKRYGAAGGKLEAYLACLKVPKVKFKGALAALGLKGKALDKAMAEMTQGIVDITHNSPALMKKEDGK